MEGRAKPTKLGCLDTVTDLPSALRRTPEADQPFGPSASRPGWTSTVTLTDMRGGADARPEPTAAAPDRAEPLARPTREMVSQEGSRCAGRW